MQGWFHVGASLLILEEVCRDAGGYRSSNQVDIAASAQEIAEAEQVVSRQSHPGCTAKTSFVIRKSIVQLRAPSRDEMGALKR